MLSLSVFLIVAAATLAYANGANDNVKPFATLVAGGTMSIGQAIRWATVSQLAGSAASLALAGGLVRNFSGKGLVGLEVVGMPVFLLAVAVGAASAVLIATRLALPISTTHALVGGLVGAGLVLSGSPLAWSALFSAFLLPLLLSPLLAFGLTLVLYPLARRARLAWGVTAASRVVVAEAYEPLVLYDKGEVAAARRLRLTHESDARVVPSAASVTLGARSTVAALHRFSASGLGFARGLNDTPKIFALLVAAHGVPPMAGLVGVGVLMAIGGVVQGQRVAETMGHKIASMNEGQGFVTNLTGTLLVLGASVLGSPVSTTHVTNGAIFGISVWSDTKNPTMIRSILLAWVATLPLAGAVAALLAYLLG